MNRLVRIFGISLALLLAGIIGFSPAPAAAAKQLVVGTGAIDDSTGDEAARTVDIPVTLKGGFNDVNGLTFTLLFDQDVFEFVELVQGDKSLYDGDDYESGVTPSTDTITNGLIFIANNPEGEGRVLIASAGAEFLVSDTSDVVPFKARFRAKPGAGYGAYPINVQQTIIGPETAEAAGYKEPTSLPVAVGLAPDADPTTAQSYSVELVAGRITLGGGYQISAQVQYQGGENADGATVRLRKKLGDSFVTDGEATVSGGTVSFTNKPNGEYKLVILSGKAGYQHRYEGDVFTVSDGNVDRGTITLAAYSPISGKITVNGDVIKGVKARVTLGDLLVGTYPVDANGNFVTTPLDPSKEYTVTAVYGNQESDAFTGDKDWDLALGSLSGTVSGLSDGQRVMLHIVSSSAGLEKLLTRTGSGDYKFENLLVATDYIVSAVGDGIPVTYYDGKTDISKADKQAVSEGQETGGIDFAFDAGVQAVSGTVTLGGDGAASVPVFAFDEDTYATQAAYTDQDGNYTLNLPDGSYLVFALKRNGKTFYYKTAEESTQVESQAATVEVAGQDVQGIDIFLDEANCLIQGRISFKTQDGDPVEGIMVWAEGPNGNALGVTDENGEYELSGLSCGDEHEVTIFPGAPYPPQTKTATPSEEGAILNFVIQTGWTFAGKVIDKDSQDPIQDAWVYLKDRAGKLQGVPARTKSDGTFSLADLPTGIYTVFAEHKDYRPVRTPNVSVQYDVSDYRIEMTKGASISGTVLEHKTDGLPGVHVSATRVGEATRYATTDGNGEFTIPGLSNGKTYGLFFYKKGYPRQYTQVAAPEDALEVPMDAPDEPVSFSGEVELGQDGDPVAGAKVVIHSADKKYHASTTTGQDGGFSFTGVVASSDYKLVVIPGRGRPGYVEDPLDLSSSITDKVITIPVQEIKGTVTLSDNATGALVAVYLLRSDDQKCVADVVAAGEGDGTYTYTFENVSSGTYNVGAFSPGYGLVWYDGVAGIGNADEVNAGAAGVDITLDPN